MAIPIQGNGFLSSRVESDCFLGAVGSLVSTSVILGEGGDGGGLVLI